MKLIVVLMWFCTCVQASDISKSVFGSVRDGMPAAFGDFNSDELTDVFVLRNNRRTVEVLLAAEEEPLLRPSSLHCNFTQTVTSVVPGDFDGDAFMDILVTTAKGDADATSVHIIWGGLDHVNCSDESHPVLVMHGQPLALDYNQDMIIDLFGVSVSGNRTIWEFSNDRTIPPTEHVMYPPESHQQQPVRDPHSHAYLDLNADYTADLFITGKDEFEVWYGVEDSGFVYNRSIQLPADVTYVGQSLFIDVQLVGRMDLVQAVCYDTACTKSAILVWTGGVWHNLQVNFKDNDNSLWRFIKPDVHAGLYRDTITMRSGDFNLDGYPDLLVTLTKDSSSSGSDVPHAYLLENVPCTSGCGNFSRTYTIRWTALAPLSNGTRMAVFYDFFQDGILDVIVVQENGTGAFKNSLDYDANFIKVMVLTGLTNQRSPTVVGRLGKKKRTYGTNLPGPRISYNTTTQEGDTRHGASAQLPQSGHFALGLPYTIFGLGRTPNFVDSLTVGLSNRSRDWTQIIPNSQMVVIPWPIKEPTGWRAQLFVTPSKLILMSVAALTAVCGVITVIIAALYWRERQQDKKERLQQSHRFHFDAM
ncbi:uncharacterized protein CBL_01786 [Carabus blaptoides fortunei]